MKMSDRFYTPWIVVAIGLLVWEPILNDTRAQQPGSRATPDTPTLEQRGGGGGGGRGGGGGGRGGGRGGGGRRGGNPEASRRRNPFADLPWGAQQLLEGHRQTLQRLHPALRIYVLTSLQGWDDLFPSEKQKFETFFEKVATATPDNFREYFQDALPRLGGEQRGRGRGRGMQIELTSEQLSKIGDAVEGYVLAGQEIFPALVVIALSPADDPPDGPVLQDDLLSRGTLLKGIAFSGSPRSWMATLLTGCEDAVKGKALRYPSFFEYRNRELEDKSHARTIALYLNKDGPPEASKSKGFGKKYGPLTVRASDFEKAAGIVKEKLEEAAEEGYSERYIEVMVKPELTPDLLKINKIVKEEALARLITRTLLGAEENRKLENAFLRTIAGDCLRKGQPGLFLAHLKDDGSPENRTFLQETWNTLQERVRYKDRAILAVLNPNEQQALLIGPGIEAGREVSGSYTLQNLSVTLSRLANIQATQAQGSPLEELVSR